MKTIIRQLNRTFGSKGSSGGPGSSSGGGGTGGGSSAGGGGSGGGGSSSSTAPAPSPAPAPAAVAEAQPSSAAAAAPPPPPRTAGDGGGHPLGSPGGIEGFSPATVAQQVEFFQRMNSEEDRQLREALALSLQETAPNPSSAPAARNAPDSGIAGSGLGSGGATGDDMGPAYSTTKDVETSALQSLSEVVATCLATESMFVDPEFAPSLKVLYANGRCRRTEADQLLIVQHYERSHGRDIQWRRPGQILQRPDDLMMDFESQQEMIFTMQQMARHVQWKVFQSDPNPADISQGALGNCWFCGSLASVAEKPDLVKRLFVDDYSKNGDLNPVGVYLVKLCDGGEWCFVRLDDNFPCNQAGMLAYSGARRNQLWVPLVEKAFAKMRGCYEETEGGNPCEGLRLLTGWPSMVLHLQKSEDHEVDSSKDPWDLRAQASIPFVDEELLWVRLVSARDARLIICGSCGHVEGISKEMYRGMGLSPSHCYSIVHVAAAKQGAVRLVKLRNPWGTGLKWKGDFNDHDETNWTDEVKAEVGADDLGTDGGIFWMTLQDLRKYFNSITICPYRDGWSEARLTSVFPPSLEGPQPAFFLERPANGSHSEVLLSCMQPEERQSVTTMTADLGLVWFRVPMGSKPRAGANASSEPYGSNAMHRQKLHYLDSMERQVRDTAVTDYFMEEPESSAGWLAVPLSFNQRVPSNSSSHSFGAGSGPKRFTFASFSAREIPLRAVDVAPEVVRDALVAHVKKVGTCGNRSNGVELWKLAEAGLVVYLENASSHFVELNVELTELFNMTVSRGVQADSTGDLSMKSRDMIPPMHGMVVFVAAAMPAGHSYRFSSRFVPKHDHGPGPGHSPALREPGDALHTPFYLDSAVPFGGGTGHGHGHGHARGGRQGFFS